MRSVYKIINALEFLNFEIEIISINKRSFYEAFKMSSCVSNLIKIDMSHNLDHTQNTK